MRFFLINNHSKQCIVRLLQHAYHVTSSRCYRYTQHPHYKAPSTDIHDKILKCIMFYNCSSSHACRKYRVQFYSSLLMFLKEVTIQLSTHQPLLIHIDHIATFCVSYYTLRHLIQHNLNDISSNHGRLTVQLVYFGHLSRLHLSCDHIQ